MTPQKKKIYIIIIVICFGATGVLLYKSFNPSSPAPAPVVTTTDTSAAAAAPAATVGQGGSVSFRAPAVFPADTKFDWTVLDSAKFQSLSQDPSLTLDPSQIGRDDPLKPF